VWLSAAMKKQAAKHDANRDENTLLVGDMASGSS